MKTMMFNPYTGTPRHPSDIASDPEGILIIDPDSPLRAAKPDPDVYALFWAMRAKILKLPRYSFLLGNGGGVCKVADRYGKWIEADSAAGLCEVESVDALIQKAGDGPLVQGA